MKHDQVLYQIEVAYREGFENGMDQPTYSHQKIGELFVKSFVYQSLQKQAQNLPQLYVAFALSIENSVPVNSYVILDSFPAPASKEDVEEMIRRVQDKLELDKILGSDKRYITPIFWSQLS